MIAALSKYVFHPLWDLKEGSQRLTEWRRLESMQWWDEAELRNYQTQRLKAMVGYSAKHSWYYRNLFKSNGLSFTDDNFSLEDFKKVPVTTKKEVRNFLPQFISEQFQRDNLVQAKTGGSTGVSLELYFDKTCQEYRNAAQLMADRWSGWDIGQAKAAVWGNPPTPVGLKQVLRHHLHDRTIYLDTMDLNPDSMNEFVAHWRRVKPEAVFGHAHSIFIFAKYLVDNQIGDLRPRGIVATSMMLLDHERKLIEQAFECPVTNRYGCEEVGLIACECEEHDGMHINTPHVFVELLDSNDQPVKPGEPGKIVLTDLNNYGMPLIRYRVEDVGVYSERSCRCGRGLPILERLEGRVADFLVLPSGGQVAGISLIERTLSRIPGIEQMQLVQESIDLITINRVKGHDYDANTDPGLIQAMRETFDESVRIEINDVGAIAQEPSGKYRFSICKV
ncbi:MAG: hypothetical protein R3175_02375 [Marinobacter sp.]|uniref:phenylacetate--CoA ligase family protein n=1 Tax=Marinobacter sp. TaxID=50741 RepID=UPI00299D80E8|nr:hypothetical protein [Marinobacter sp.]MDX1754883.1 hypothetical protein [Marinobacter sp.]